MPLATPVLWSPPDGETNVPLDNVLVVTWSAISGGGAQREARIRVRLAADASVVWDSLLRENDDLSQGDQWCDVPLPEFDPLPQPSTSYTIGVLVRDVLSASSSESTVHTFTTAAAPVTAATFRAAA